MGDLGRGLAAPVRAAAPGVPGGLGLVGPLAVGLVAFVTAAVAVVGLSTTPAGTSVEPWIDTGNREAVLVAFAEEYADDTPDMDWTGAHDSCRPGDSSDDLRVATLRRINYYRAMAGVPTGIVENEEFSRKAQAGALTMSAQGELSHTPHDGFACLTRDGVDAAANSNLYLGRTGPRAIDGYIEDPGERNRDVGHRNTILHPPTREMGVGHVAGTADHHPANALWVFDEQVFAANPAVREADGFVAWPPRGHVPPELVYPRWSFGLAGADFEQAEVSMSVDGEPVPFEIVARLSQQGYVPAPIIVWEPVGVHGAAIDGAEADATPGGSGGGDGPEREWIDPLVDTTFDIVVEHVILDGRPRRFEYSVTVIGDRPAPPAVAEPAGPEGRDDSLLARVVSTAIDGARELAPGGVR